MSHSFLSRIAVGLAVWSGPSGALTLEFPGPADATGGRTEGMTSYRMPVGPFSDGAVQTQMTEGPLDQSAWRIAMPGLTTLQLLQSLRDQVAEAGYKVVYECEAAVCGGFDFRYATEVLPEPDMHVDLGDFRYLAATRDTAEGPEYLSLIVSRALDLGFVQMTRVGKGALPVPEMVTSTKTPDLLGRDGLVDPLANPADPAQAHASISMPVQNLLAAPKGGLAERLATGGTQVLSDLTFASGSAALTDGEFASLTELAAFLAANPQTKIMLVGHTDASGGLEANIVLSRQRAQSVRQRLLTDFDVAPGQIGAEGVGFLSPRASNDTESGRLANRRVEVMLMADAPN